MSDMSEPDDTPVTTTVPPAQADFDLGVLDLPPAKVRRRGPDRLTRMLLIFLAMVLAFSCGTKVGKSAKKAPAPAPAATANGKPASGAAVSGRVKVMDGNAFYVTDAKGETVKVLTDDSTRLVTTQPGSLSDLRPGDTVEVKGKRNPDGTVAATSLTNTPATSPG
jgi:FtsP/CotA-like multicopper oxidase with cupredoxin domain